ncbi:Tetratricopeptide repeat protein GNN [Cricetulus griseus]|uniref:Tetratricopeptide repeat protein GNN n=1 Tax=Cricetulus griseus TaxID=10029 RepID=G3HQM8_CRIGR|nr:Tetratricopeptide repeat protein GNN [Cricetulus griseus]
MGDEDTKFSIFKRHLCTRDKERFEQSRPILRKKPNLNPLKLTVIASELQECRIYRNEFQCLREYLEVASVQELWELILKRWVEDYSWNLKPKEAIETVASGLSGWVADALCLLCISHCGLAEQEVLQLLDMLGYRNHQKVTTVHWAAFRNATKHWILEKPNGLLCFQHQSLRTTVEHKLLGVITLVRESSPNTSQSPVNHKKTRFHQVLMRYFQRQTVFWRVYQELPWHMKMSGCWEGLCDFVTSPGLLREIQRFRSRRCRSQGMRQLHPESSRNGSLLWENLSKLNCRSAQSSDTVNTAMCMNIRKFQRAKSTVLSPPPVSDKPKYAPGKGKKTLTPILCLSAGEKALQKAQSTQIWNGPRNQIPRKNMLSPGEKSGLAILSRQRVFSAKSESGDGLITPIYHQPLQAPVSPNNPWGCIPELVSENWLFHSPQYSFFRQKPVFIRRSQIETKWLKTSNDTNKE